MASRNNLILWQLAPRTRTHRGKACGHQVRKDVAVVTVLGSESVVRVGLLPALKTGRNPLLEVPERIGLAPS